MTEYQIGAELPDLAITWTDDGGDVIDFSTGWTFTLKLGQLGSAAEVTKTTGITGAATAPNVTVTWTAGEFDSLAAGARVAQVFARHTASGKDRSMTFPFTLKPAIT